MQSHFKFEQKTVLTTEPDTFQVREEKLFYAKLWNDEHDETYIMRVSSNVF